MSDDPMSGETFLRTVGRRHHAPRSTREVPGSPPPEATRRALANMARYSTRVPRGVFIYRSHEEANGDWDRWRQQAMLANSRVPRDD